MIYIYRTVNMTKCNIRLAGVSTWNVSDHMNSKL